jgi:hypothetical protein
MSFLSGSIKDLNASKDALPNEEPAALEKVPNPRKRRFSVESLNDLLFWGCHLLVVAISLAIMWVKVDGTTRALKKLLVAESQELELVKGQALAAQAAAQEARNAEHTRSIQFSTATGVLEDVVAKVRVMQFDVKESLAKATETNTLVLAASNASRVAALQAQGAAQEAAGAAGGAASAASRAAALSSHTGSVVAAKVVTTADRRSLEAQQQALARKQAQLTRTIKQVKKNGPTLIQQLFH